MGHYKINMATLRDIKKRTKSVQNIAQITNAMQMVAASKMRRAQEQTQHFLAYAQKILEITKELADTVDASAHKLLQEGNPAGKKLLVIIATDKGLCGALNSNMFRQITKWYANFSAKECITIGKKAVGFARGNNLNISADFSGAVPVKKIAAVNTYIVEGFLVGRYSEVEIIFNRFVNSFTQEPTRIQVLPIAYLEQDLESAEQENKKRADFLIEPSPDKVLDALLPEYIENQIRDAALSAEASEYSARMIAMKNATDNAKSLVDDLTLEYNKLRQMDITLSIADMVTARLAVEQ